MKKFLVISLIIAMVGRSFSYPVFIADKYTVEVEDATKNHLRISMVGDNITHSAVLTSGAYAIGLYDKVEIQVAANGKKYLPAGTKFNYDNMYKRLMSTLSTCDINIINMESVAAGDDKDLSSFPYFNAPRALYDAALHEQRF